MTAIDTTVGLSSAQIAGLRAAGVTAVSRYIAPQAWKRITPAEYTRIIGGGLQVSLNWESGAQDLKTLGSTQTRTFALEAVRQAQACGYPRGCVILNSADWDVSAGDWPVVAANLRVIRPIYSAAGYGLGLYGPWDALGWAKYDGLVDVFWQAGMSTAWSGGRNRSAWPGAHLRQRRNATIAGVDCDTNDILIAAFGQAGAGSTPISTGGTTMSDPTVEAFLARDFIGKPMKDWLGAVFSNYNQYTQPLADIGGKLDTLLARPAGGAVDLDALAEKITAALVASNANGLTAADHAAVVEDVKTALRSGTGQ